MLKLLSSALLRSSSGNFIFSFTDFSGTTICVPTSEHQNSIIYGVVAPEMGLISYAENSVRNNYYCLRNNSEEQSRSSISLWRPEIKHTHDLKYLKHVLNVLSALMQINMNCTLFKQSALSVPYISRNKRIFIQTKSPDFF